MTPCLSSAPSSTGYCERRHRSVDNVKSVGLEFKIWVGSFRLYVERSGTKTYDVMYKLRPFVHWLLSTASLSMNNVKPVDFEFKIWVVDMLSVRWERGACAVALMLRADIRQFSIVRRLDEDICAVALMLRADILSTTLTSGTFTAIENSLLTTTGTCRWTGYDFHGHPYWHRVSK